MRDRSMLSTQNRIRIKINQWLYRRYRDTSLSIAMIRRLHDELGIPADVLIRPTRKDKVA